jgi:MYXO-CTERM domain-containing protein
MIVDCLVAISGMITPKFGYGDKTGVRSTGIVANEMRWRLTEMNSQTHNRRFERYFAVAALPAVGLAGQSLADVIHYGGSTIRIERNDYSGGSGSGEYFGQAGLGFPAGFNADDALGMNRSMTAAMSSEYASASAAMRVGMLSNGGIEGLGFAVCADGGIGQLGGLAGGVFGSDMAAGCNLLHFFQAGSIIDDQIQMADSGAVAMSVSAMATVFGDTVVDEQFATGEWASLGTDEMRGFVGWGMDSPDGTTFGWMDVGWDGEVLSIYDWAFSTNGSIAAGQTSEVSAVPGGTGLAALAMGAAGLRRRRNRSA